MELDFELLDEASTVSDAERPERKRIFNVLWEKEAGSFFGLKKAVQGTDGGGRARNDAVLDEIKGSGSFGYSVTSSNDVEIGSLDDDWDDDPDEGTDVSAEATLKRLAQEKISCI